MPHFASHLLHLPHLPILQSLGQGLVLHGLLSFRDPHAAPPGVGLTRGFRLLYLHPPLQDLLHTVHELHDETTQFDGHGFDVQLVSSDRKGHASPWYLGSRTIFRMRTLVPGPHTDEQGLHFFHCETLH